MLVSLYRSRARNNKDRYIILTEHPAPGSLAEYLLLKKSLQTRDPNYNVGYWLVFRCKWLRERKREVKTLTCTYCSKYLTVKNGKKNSATVDHIIPISRGGDRFDPSNMTVCCPKCNNRKGDKLLCELESVA